MYKITCDGLPILNTRHEDYIVLDPKVNVGVNTVGECTFKIYTDHPHYNDLQPLKSVFEVSDENGVIFRGRMTNNTRDFYNGKAVDLEGSMAFFNDSIVKPFVFPDDFSSSLTVNVVEYFLDWLIDQHNQQVKPFQRFKLGNVTVTDPNNYISRSSENITSTWQILKEKLFESSLGGYLCIRYESDGNYIDYLASFEDVNTQEIRLGQNLFDMKHETDATATYSAIIPIGADLEVEGDNGETTTKKLTLESIEDGKLNDTDDTYKVTLDNGLHAIYSESAIENYGWICCPVEDSTWDDVTDVNNLKNKARNYLLETARFLADNIEATAADLHFTDAQIRSFRMYKKVKVVSKPHGIADYYNLTKLEIDLLNPQNTKIVVGQSKMTLTDSVSKGGAGKSTTVSSDNISTALGYTPTSNADIAAKISKHNSSETAHPDIRKLIENLEITGGGGIAEETDPTVPAWAKAPTKPTYTADEVGARPDTWTPSASDVGADPSGTAEEKVSGHNTNTEAHNDIRLLIEGLNTRLNTLADSDDTTLDQLSELVAYIKSNRSLIENVTTNKVDVDDIINNLTSPVINQPLSAKQGVVLKSLIDDLSDTKANKATTLAGYGITDGATKDEVKALETDLGNHTSDDVAHITAEERSAWNGKANPEDIPTKYSDLTDDIGYTKQTDFDELSEFTHGAVEDIVDAVLELQEKGGTPHDHSWEDVGVAHYETGGDTLTSDDVIYDSTHKVYDTAPSLEDVQKGGTISYYSVVDGKIDGELITANYPEGTMTISSKDQGVVILLDGYPLVVIAFEDGMTFLGVTYEKGVHFAQDSYYCVHSFTINGYTGFPNTVLQKLPRERLPEEFDELSDWVHQAVDEIVEAVIEHRSDKVSHITAEERTSWGRKAEPEDIPTKYSELEDDIGTVKTVNYIAPDKNGNVNVEGSGGTSEAFDLVKSSTLMWNGDTEGKVIVESEVLPELPFVKASDAIPTLAELQEGVVVTWNSGQSYECVAEDLEEGEHYIRDIYNSFIIIEEENTTFTEGSATYVFPKTGTYLMNCLEEGNEDFVSEITINNYAGFTKPVLKIESLTPHGHDWYGKAVNKGNTVRGDDIVHGGFVKVSDAVPTLAEVQNGGTLRYYNVVDNELSGDLIIANYLESPYGVYSANGQILIASDGIAMVQIKADGVYFRQDETDCVHSLTINEYTGFSFNLEKVPAELLPEDYIKQLIEEIVGSMNILITKE